MKKFILVLAALTAGVANAAEVSASFVHDSKAERDGFRVEASAGKLFGVKPVLGLTHINDSYTRYSVGADYPLVNLGNLSLAASASGVFQDTKVGQNGFGLTVGAKAVLPVSKTVDVVGRVDRFYGQDRVSGFNGTVGSLGVSVKF